MHDITDQFEDFPWSWYDGILDPASDVDYCSFSAEAGRSFRIEVSLDTLLDSILTLYDSTGTALREDDDGGEGWGSLITWTAPVSGTYYLQVRPYNPSTQTGSYSLILGVS